MGVRIATVGLNESPVIKLLTAYERLPRNARGALWMLASALTFTVMTTLVKFLGADYPAALQNFYRQAASLLVFLPAIIKNPKRTFATTRPGILVFRAAAGTLGVTLAFYAYQKMRESRLGIAKLREQESA
jgi:drug/metabolite transporter (DMT)-like permease